MARSRRYTKQRIESECGAEGNRAFEIAETRVLQTGGNELLYAGFLSNGTLWFIQSGDFDDEYEIGLIDASSPVDTELTRNGNPRKDGYSFYRVLGTFDEIVDELNASSRLADRR